MNATVDTNNLPLAKQAGSALQDHACDVFSQLIGALRQPWSKGAHAVPTETLCAAIQLIHAGLPNLRDAERFDQLNRIGDIWIVKIGGRTRGVGDIRHAVDSAIAYWKNDKGDSQSPDQKS